MRKLLFTLLLFHAARSEAQTFGSGNIVVVRIGTASTSPMTAGAAQPVFLDEYDPCGTFVRTIPMPVTASGTNRRLTLPPASGDWTEGFISRSEDGQYLALGGYDAAPGTASVTSSTSSAVNRVVGVINASANVNTSTVFNSRFSTVSIRSAVTDGTNIWSAGGNGGIVYTTVGSSSNILLTSTTGRCLNIYDGQLYATSTATNLRMARVGSGLPTTTGQTMTNLPGYATTGGNPLQFFMVRLNSSDTVNMLYIADNGQLKKFSLVSGSWVANGIIGATNDKFRGLTGTVSGSDVILYALRRNDNGGEIIKFTDNTGYNASFANLKPVIIVQADSNKVFRDLSMAPEETAPALAKKMNNSLVDLRVISKERSANALAEITAGQPVQGMLTIYDMNGRTVYSRKLVMDKGVYRYQLLMPANAHGLYFASFLPINGELITRKFIY